MHQLHRVHDPEPSGLKSETCQPVHPEDSVQPRGASQLPGAHAHGTEHAGHDQHAGHNVAMFRRKFGLSLVLTLPVLIWGHMLQRALGYTAPLFPGAEWISPVFGTAVFFFGGWVFIQGAVDELRSRMPGMMTLIA